MKAKRKQIYIYMKVHDLHTIARSSSNQNTFFSILKNNAKINN
jgi:hypothetical protein